LGPIFEKGGYCLDFMGFVPHVTKNTPALQKPEGFRVKASKGEVVVFYFEPSATQDLKFSDFPAG